VGFGSSTKEDVWPIFTSIVPLAIPINRRAAPARIRVADGAKIGRDI
jgi:hypothetical protein